jgi:hypothetical protein
MIQRWADNLTDRQVITEFFEWLERHHTGKSTFDMDIEKILDAYHKIDRKQLDDERRATLDEVRKPLLSDDIPAGLYIVKYYHDGWDASLPACELKQARKEAKERANRYQVECTITGIGPERGFEELVKPDHLCQK